MTTECRCVVCWERWDIDMDPVGCVCEDGGLWQLWEKGRGWGLPVNREGEPGELPR